MAAFVGASNHNICCVGDDDQSIYAWRGADISNILNFEKDFPEATIIRLEQNYRSTPHILNAANGLIAHNTGRLGKNLWTNEAEGDKVTITATMDQNDEARQIADEIESLQHKCADLDEIAVLVRTSAQMRAFEERFNTVGIPYRVIGGPRFYERMEIRDAIAYLRLINQLNDDLAFERIVNTPKRGLGAKTIQDLQLSARAMRNLFSWRQNNWC
jgi:DNA helicase-2/ATP-dependent DNA helicase PcrA